MKQKCEKTKEEAIKEFACREKECSHFKEDGIYSFCKAIFTEESCLVDDDR